MKFFVKYTPRRHVFGGQTPLFGVGNQAQISTCGRIVEMKKKLTEKPATSSYWANENAEVMNFGKKHA